MADMRIAELENFVDSLKSVSDSEREANWDRISADFDRKETNANAALITLDEETKEASQTKIDASTYNTLWYRSYGGSGSEYLNASVISTVAVRP